ncbi:homoserine kinase [Urechidicola vernalis]|uniref:Homoserine kinase n=1 Tax=Urechidicola vernalis TaxID=3075600 RepID=A0ABU2Y183_9FLAO|nr:homoserine kinase [Urechidicola sp. P050]MDT0551896.1 homoserine kinase [Urechidicola sp. P050]
MKEIKIFSPATVANVSCGFDVLGFCLDTVGDVMTVRKTKAKGIAITKIEGASLPYEPENNVAGVAAKAILDAADNPFGVEIEIYKNIKPGSGVGSSSASASGTVWAINELLGRPFNKQELTAFGMKGEALASGAEHADNVAPGIFGGFTLVKQLNPLKVVQLPTPSEMWATIIHPQIEVKTAEARAILPKEVSLQKAIKQWANVGSFISGLYDEDYELISDSLIDNIVEPHRSQLIPYFDEVKKAMLDNGALGAGISGSGPSIFSLCKGEATAMKVAEVINKVYESTEIEFDIYVSKINTSGVKVLNLK